MKARVSRRTTATTGTTQSPVAIHGRQPASANAVPEAPDGFSTEEFGKASRSPKRTRTKAPQRVLSWERRAEAMGNALLPTTFDRAVEFPNLFLDARLASLAPQQISPKELQAARERLE